MQSLSEARPLGAEGAPPDRDEALSPQDDRTDAEWVTLAKDCYSDASSARDAHYKDEVCGAWDHFHSKHQAGSKYASPDYGSRSKLFRPKSRMVVRAHEAAMVAAMFSTVNSVTIGPNDDSDPIQKYGAKLNDALLNERLQEDHKWFMNVVGGTQTAHTSGLVYSKQTWEMDKATQAAGPNVRLIPFQNLLFSSAADWTDPIRQSPFLIELVPMYVIDIKGQMKPPPAELAEDDSEEGQELRDVLDNVQTQDTDTGAIFEHCTEADFAAAREFGLDQQVAAQAQSGRDDQTTDKSNVVRDHDIVWVREVFIRAMEGGELVEKRYRTLGSEKLLSKPQPLDAAYSTGSRPYAYGMAMIEAGNPRPAGTIAVFAPLQEELNAISNERRDNVGLAMNRRYIVRKGARLNYRVIMRSVPGSIIEASNIHEDLRSEAAQDVTRSAYEEQDRVNVDIDDLGGVFSGSSVSTNRNLNETVGGMKMLKSNGSAMQEYSVKTVAEVWIEQVLRQLVHLQQANETDMTRIRAAGRKAGLKADVADEQLMEYLQAPVRVSVNIGQGATDPDSRIQRIVLGMGTLAQYFPDKMAASNFPEIAQEVWGALGYANADRFHPELAEQEENPMVANLQAQMEQMSEQMQQMQMMLQTDQAKQAATVKVAEMRKEQADADRQVKLFEIVSNIEADEKSEMAKIKADMMKVIMKQRAEKQQFANEVAVKDALGPTGNFGLGE